MDQQAQILTTDDPVDRTLSITAKPSLIWDANGMVTSVTFAYSQGPSNPNMPNAVNETNGNINLKGMPANSNFTNNVDITINLDDSTALGPNGAHVTVRFALPTESNNDGTGPIWFCATPAPGDPKNPAAIATPTGMSIGENSITQVYINDDQADGGSSYSFCMAVVVPSSTSTTPITIDPVITGKGKNTFMLSE